MRPEDLNWLRFVICGCSGGVPTSLGPGPRRGDRSVGCRGIRVCSVRRGWDRVRFSPERARHANRVDARGGPPAGFVAGAVQLAMMSTAEWHGELVADLEAKTAGLREAQMVGIAGLPGTDQAWLFGDESKVVLIAVAAQLGKRQHALVDLVDWLRMGFRCLLRSLGRVGWAPVIEATRRSPLRRPVRRRPVCPERPLRPGARRWRLKYSWSADSSGPNDPAPSVSPARPDRPAAAGERRRGFGFKGCPGRRRRGFRRPSPLAPDPGAVIACPLAWRGFEVAGGRHQAANPTHPDRPPRQSRPA